MNHRVIGGGAVVCSAVVFYGWMQPLATKAGLPACQDTPTDSKTSPTSEPVQPPEQANCTQQGITSLISNLPDLLPFDLQWSQLRSQQLPGRMEATYEDMIKQAQELANRNQYAEAMSQTTGIPKNSRHYAMAQQLQENWSRELLQRATKSYQASDLVTAINTLNTVPPTCAQFSKASELRQRWSQQAMKLERAFAAKDAGDWQGVIGAIQSLEGTQLYYTSPVQELLQYAMIQQFAPDAELMQFVVANGVEPTSAAAPVREIVTASPDFALAPVEPLPDLADATIDLNQAMEWVQPPVYTAMKPSKTAQQKIPVDGIPTMTTSPLQSSEFSSYDAPLM